MQLDLIVYMHKTLCSLTLSSEQLKPASHYLLKSGISSYAIGNLHPHCSQLVLAPALQWMRPLCTCSLSIPSLPVDLMMAHTLTTSLWQMEGPRPKCLDMRWSSFPYGEALDTNSNMLLDGDGGAEHGVLGHRVQAQVCCRICCQGC